MGPSIEEQRNKIREKNDKAAAEIVRKHQSYKFYKKFIKSKKKRKLSSRKKHKKPLKQHKKIDADRIIDAANICAENQRSNPTTEEIALRKHLDEISARYEYQHIIFTSGTYFVLDFYFPDKQLCVELDGYYHFTEDGIKRDQQRGKYLKKLNINTLRIPNYIIRNNVKYVDKYIE